MDEDRQTQITGISQQQLSTDELEHLNSALNAIRDVARLINVESDVKTLMQKICRSIVSNRGYVNAWIIHWSDDGKLLNSAQFHVGKAFNRFLGAYRQGHVPSCIQDAVRDGELVCIHPPTDACRGCALHEADSGHSILLMPLLHEDKIYGVIGGALPPGFVRLETEMSFIKGVAWDIAFAFNHNEVRQAKEQAVLEKERSESYFKELFDNVDDALFYHDEKGQIINVNKMARDRLGYTHDELCAMTMTDISEKDQIRLVKKTISEISKKGRITFETVQLTRNGEAIPVEVTSRLVEFGGQEAVLSSARDISGRIEADRKLKEREARLRNIVEYSSNLFYSHTADHKLTYLSPQTELFFDCSPEEALINWTELLTSNPINKLGVAITERAIKTGKVQKPYELELRGLKGRTIWVEVREAPIVDDGKTVAIVGSLTDITARKTAERNLQLATASAGMGSWTLDNKSEVLEWDDLMFQIYGLDPAEFNGRYEDWQSRVHPEDLEAVEEAVQEAIRDSSDFHAVFRIVRPGGEIRYVDAHARMHFFDDGGIEKMVGVNLDITSLKNKEEELKESETRLKSYIDHAPVGVFVADETGICIDVNPAACRMTGYSKAKLTGMNLLDLLAESGVNQAMAHFRAFTEGPQPTLELPFIRKNGDKRFWTVDAVKLSDTRFLGFMKDVTERRQFENAMMQEKEKAQLYLDIAGVMIVALDAKGCIMLANKKAAQILETDMHYLIGKNWFDNFLEVDDREEMISVFGQMIAGDIQSLEYSENAVRTATGARKLIAWHNTVLKDDDGRILGTLSSGEDITDRKEAERQLKANMEELSRFNRLMVGRELKMAALKQEVNSLLSTLGQPPRYNSDAEELR